MVLRKRAGDSLINSRDLLFFSFLVTVCGLKAIRAFKSAPDSENCELNIEEHQRFAHISDHKGEKLNQTSPKEAQKGNE